METPPDQAAWPLGHPAWIFAMIIAAACTVIAVTFPIGDPDLWQHLAVGRAIGQLHEVPRLHQWTWTFFGSPEVLPSWGFRALLWPFWSAGVCKVQRRWRPGCRLRCWHWV